MMITAHSGFDGTKPNSMGYIRQASSLPIDALEVDIRRGISGKPVCSHDPIGMMPLVKLDSVFQYLAHTQLKINCDLKEYGLENDVYRCAEENEINADRLILTGSVTDCKSYLTKNSKPMVFINAEELIPGFYSMKMEDNLFDELLVCCGAAGYNVINIDYRVCSEAFFIKCFEANIGLSLWTVDNVQTLGRFISFKRAIVNVTTNSADVVSELKSETWSMRNE